MKLAIIKKILVIGPVLPDWGEIHVIQQSLGFIKHPIIFIDPLKDFSRVEHQASFLKRWREKLNLLKHTYDVFIGFSLGGIILQENLDIFTDQSVILFSVPTYADDVLSNRLNTVIKLVQEKSVSDAIHEKNRYIFSPYPIPDYVINLANEKIAADRLITGLQYVLNIDSRLKLQLATRKVLHLIGEQSQLVNLDNVVAPPLGELVVVPLAGMRVLQNNPLYCADTILNFLNG